jgi:hypothetical protein
MRKPSARAMQLLLKVCHLLPRCPQTGANSRVQACGRAVLRHGPVATTRNPSARARQEFEKVLVWLPRWPQTGACSNVQA